MRKRLWALTLIEVVVTVVVLAILICVLVPLAVRAREESRKKACKENCDQIGRAFVAYTMSAPWESLAFAWGPGNGACSMAPSSTNTDMCDPGASLGCLYPSYILSSRMFRCPSTEDEPSLVLNTPYGIIVGSYGGRVQPLTLYLWSQRTFTLKSNQPLAPGSAVTRVCSYGYDPRVYPAAVANMAILADWHNHADGMNVLYVDGSVKWQTTSFCSNDPIDDIFAEGGIGANGAAVYWNADTDAYLVNAATVLTYSYNSYKQLQE